MKPQNFRAVSELQVHANIGSKYAMFEAIHGSAPRMITGRDAGRSADPLFDASRNGYASLTHWADRQKPTGWKKHLIRCVLTVT